MLQYSFLPFAVIENGLLSGSLPRDRGGIGVRESDSGLDRKGGWLLVIHFNIIDHPPPVIGSDLPPFDSHGACSSRVFERHPDGLAVGRGFALIEAKNFNSLLVIIGNHDGSSLRFSLPT